MSSSDARIGATLHGGLRVLASDLRREGRRLATLDEAVVALEHVLNSRLDLGQFGTCRRSIAGRR